MQTKNLFIVLGVVVILGAVVWTYKSTRGVEQGDADSTVNMPVGMMMPVPGSNTSEMIVEGDSMMSMMKEFSMTAYYDEKGKWFSQKEMAVKKGDTVRVRITNTKGMHDFVIDELGVKQVLPLNEEVVVEFVATKAGEFVYYCSMPGHRAGGQWGTLRVTE